MVSEDPAGGHDLRGRGREVFRRRAWTDAYETLSAADPAVTVGAGGSRAARDGGVSDR